MARASKVLAGDAQGRPSLVVLSAEAERLFGKGQFGDSLAVAERLRDLAMQAGDEAFVAVSHYRSGAILTTMGNTQQAEQHLDALLAWLTPERCATLRVAAGLDFEANALAFPP